MLANDKYKPSDAITVSIAGACWVLANRSPTTEEGHEKRSDELHLKNITLLLHVRNTHADAAVRDRAIRSVRNLLGQITTDDCYSKAQLAINAACGIKP